MANVEKIKEEQEKQKKIENSKKERIDKVKEEYKKIILKYINMDKILDNIFNTLYGRVFTNISSAVKELTKQTFSSKPSQEESCRILSFGSTFWKQTVKLYSVPYDPTILKLFLDDALKTIDSGGFRVILEDKLDYFNDPIFVLSIGFSLQGKPLD